MTLPAAFLRGHIAHRGLHGPDRPENSMAAFRAAIDRGLAIELDVQPSSDGVAMAFHDADLHRLTGQAGRTDGTDADTLSRTRLLGGDGGVPRLSEVLALIAGRVPLLIEIKDQDGAMGSDVGPLERAVIDALDGYAGDVAVMSFNPHSVDVFRREAPHIPRGLVTAPFHAHQWPDLPDATRAHLAAIADFDRTGASFVSHQADALDMPVVAELRARGVPVLCWTVRSPAEEALARRHADAVTFEGYLP
ncbi:glycerophosphodiester phosphodiesterase family protein [Jannaschia rubra]|uniref:glycerophosphodiester phosphodiesterase family protein n=1 Tax=Jannaschia rubra TaxID=282197 RepID=UPI002491E8F1|nr:glycerophosphodiester phosphodiesterase family protein [Jannaschia rubra]